MMDRQLWTQSALLVSSHIVTSVLTLSVAIYALRQWGPIYSGLLTQAQSIVAVLSVLATLGLDVTLVRQLVKYPTNTSQILGSAMGLRAIGCMVLAIVLAISVAALDFTSCEQITLIALAFSSLCAQSSVVYGFKFSAISDVRPLVAAQLIQTVVFSAGRVLVLDIGGSVQWFQATYVAEAAFSFWLTRLLFKKRFNTPPLKWDNVCAKALLRESLPIVLSAFFITAFMKVDLIIISKLLPLHDVGVYSAAMRIVETYMVAIGVLFGQSMIWLTQSHGNRKLYKSRLLFLFRSGFAVSAGCLLFNALFGQHIFRLVLGDQYAKSVELSNLLGLTLFSTTAGTIRSFALSLDGLNRFHLWSALAGLATGVPLTFYLTSRQGLTGTAMSLVICYAISSIGTSWLIPSLRDIGRMQLLLPPSARTRKPEPHDQQ